MPAVQYILQNADNKMIQGLTTYQKAHYEFLKKHKGYLTKSGGKPLSISPDDRELDVAIRRACKLLVCSANENRRIHFELDHINIERICKAEPTDLGITNSEINAAYRNAKDNPHLFFYMQGESVPAPAPWNNPDNVQHFQKYDEYRRTKKRT